MEHDKQNGKQDKVPVYLSFKTLQSTVQSLRTHGLPSVLDRTAFGSRSGAEQTQILSAFKFLGLIDEENKTQPSLRNLVSVQEGTPDEKTILQAILKLKYANAFALNLESATPAQLDKAIADYGAGGATKPRSIRFFIKAAEYSGVKLSPRLTARKPRTPSAQQPGDEGKKKLEQFVSNPGSQIKTIDLPDVGGTLTVSGTFNFFDLAGDERDLVFGIIDKMKEFAAKTGSE